MKNSAEQVEARKHYDTRTERRPHQAWYMADGSLAPAKGAKGAIPRKS